jgi:threonine aldolase
MECASAGSRVHASAALSAARLGERPRKLGGSPHGWPVHYGSGPTKEIAVDAAQYGIDLRSDTVTRPTPGMRAAMAAAEVGDDVYGDDPTVNRLQAQAAERFGFESGLFFASGTQSNLAALMAHCGRGDEYLVGQEAHTYKYEQGGAAVLGSIQPQPLENEPDGAIALERIANAIKPQDIHFARTRLLALENTIGGRVLPMDYLRQATELARAHGLGTHLDGARIFNAIVKLRIDAAAAVAGFDSVSVCLSKGLGAPAGSVLLGSRDLIAQARRWRKALGGGMRQAGVLAAAGIYALEHHVEQLAQDHANAEFLAAGLRAMGLKVEPPQTNMLYAEVPAPLVANLKKHLEQRGILATIAPRTRLVTHLDLPRAKVEATLQALREFPDWHS